MASKGLDEAWAKRYYRLLGGVEAKRVGKGVDSGRLAPTSRLGQSCSNPIGWHNNRVRRGATRPCEVAIAWGYYCGIGGSGSCTAV